MADPKKNPLLGAFRSPSPSDPPPDKPDEGKKPVEPLKEVKAPAAPTKPSEEKKPVEPPKGKEEQKPAEGERKASEDKAPATPAKPGEDKKPAEGEEVPADFKLDILPTNKMGTETMVPVELIDDFEGHPFAVKDDKDMEDLVASVKQAGILEPVTIVRNPKKPGRFEMVSGHRRKHAAKLAGLTHVRAFVREMDHDEAIIAMVDSNLKREKISPMEKARAYQMKSEALRRKAGRRTKEETEALKAAGIKPKTADELLAEQTGESVATVQRTKTLTKLTEPMQKLVESGDLPVNTAADIAQMKPAEQDKLADAIEKEGGKVPSGTAAKELKEASKKGELTDKKIEAAVAPTKREVDPPLKVTLSDEDLRPYFPKGATIPDVKRGIFEALDLRKKAIERQKAKANAGKEPTKTSQAPAR